MQGDMSVAMDKHGDDPICELEKARIVRALYDVADRVIAEIKTSDPASAQKPSLQVACADLVAQADCLDAPDFAAAAETAIRYLNAALTPETQIPPDPDTRI